MPNYLPPSQPVQSQYLDPRDFHANQIQDLLRRIGMIESSGGTDTEHQQIESGRQAGDTAIGDYALMPNTLKELSNRYPSQVTSGMSKEDLADKAQSNPEFANTMAGTMASYLKDKRGLSDEETAAAWEAGHNLPTSKLNLNSPRAQKFRVLSK